MKKILVLTILFCGVISAYSQTDSLLLKSYEQKIVENSKLKNDLQSEKQNFSDLRDAYKKDTLALQKKIKDLRNEVSSEKQKVSALNKNKIKEEIDNLQTKVESLNTVISKQNQTIADKDKQIANEKANAVTTADNAKKTADNAKNDGKAEAIASIVNSYKNRSFDDLIKSSTKETVARDMQLVGNNLEVKPVLNDLQIYFNAQELLSEKFDAVQIKNAQLQLSQIKRQSKLLDALKVDVESYKDFNTALKEAISKLVNLDKNNSAGGDSSIQKLKFNDIVTILAGYMYNYYDYAKYIYLSDIVLDIIKRKQPNADADITDLLIKL